MAIPGKKGRARKKLGVFERDVEPDADITFRVAPPNIEYDALGFRTASFTPLLDPKFNMDRFRRALHHIAFNAVIAKKGLAIARGDRYAAVRNYVRQPKQRERWPFAQTLTHSLEVFVPHVGAQFLDIGDDKVELMRIRIFNSDFYVDLQNRGRLLTARVEGSAFLVLPDWKQPTQSASADGKIFRVSIMKPERPNAGLTRKRR